MIKGKPPFPFETIGLAVSFSPGLPNMIREMKRLCDLHGSSAIFIHIGKKTGEKQRELSTHLNANGFHDGNSMIIWEQNEVVVSLLEICKNEVVDLLLLGVSDKDNFSLPAGKVTMEIATKAKCSLMIFARLPADGFRKIVINGADHRKTDLTVQTAVYFSGKENVSEISFMDSEKLSSISGVAEKIAKRISSGVHADNKAISINYITSGDQPEQSINEFAFRNNADLIVTNSTDHELRIFDRVSTGSEITDLLSNLSSNLLIVHSRLKDL